MKLETRYKRNAREVSLITQSNIYASLSQHFSDLAKGEASTKLELVWFLKDSRGKIYKTGNSNMMSFRRSQIWKNFRHVSSHSNPESIQVHLIDLMSGIQSKRTLKYALSKSNEALREEMVSNILGLSRS